MVPKCNAEVLCNVSKQQESCCVPYRENICTDKLLSNMSYSVAVELNVNESTVY